MTATAPFADILNPVQIEVMSASKLIGAIVLITVPCAWIYIVLAGAPRLQIGIANGRFANHCCDRAPRGGVGSATRP